MKFNIVVSVFLLALMCFMLFGCSSTQEVLSAPIERSRLNLQQPAPIKLKSVMYTAIGDGTDRRYQLTQEQFNNLMADFELLQNRMYFQNVIISKYVSYYEPTESK